MYRRNNLIVGYIAVLSLLISTYLGMKPGHVYTSGGLETDFDTDTVQLNCTAYGCQFPIFQKIFDSTTARTGYLVRNIGA